MKIDDHLLAEAKALAARGHRSLGDVVDDALRALLVERADLSSTPERVVLPTDGGSGLRPGVDLEDKEALAEILGENAPFHAVG